jgi:hypothetical protein
MTLNPYFLNGSPTEQRLIKDLINEQLRMFGQEIVYMPRKYITEKTIIKELIASKFDTGFYLEAYISNFDGFGGQGDILSKFGVRSTDEMTFIISKERYEEVISYNISGYSDIKLTTRPQEGDLIYLPLDNGLFEIKYVEGKRPFYQLNDLYVYELKCELFEYEDEIISTGLDEVDNTIKNFGYTQTLTMVPSSAIPARFITRVSSTTQKSIQYVDVLNGGHGYISTPTVTFSNSNTNEDTPIAVAIMTSNGNANSIDKILIINPGLGYTVPPKIIINSNSGSGFAGTCIISTGVLDQMTVISNGSGYSTAPTVSISPSPTGKNAKAIAVLNSSGAVAEIRYIDAGAGYNAAPTISISSPIGISTGTYTYNEIIEGVSSGTKAYVKGWDYNSRILKVSIIDGAFILGESIVGSTANYKILSIKTDDIYDAYASNEEIETLADQVIDFSEKNPFGEF